MFQHGAAASGAAVTVEGTRHDVTAYALLAAVTFLLNEAVPRGALVRANSRSKAVLADGVRAIHELVYLRKIASDVGSTIVDFGKYKGHTFEEARVLYGPGGFGFLHENIESNKAKGQNVSPSVVSFLAVGPRVRARGKHARDGGGDGAV